MEGATYTGSEKFYGMDAKTFADVLKKNNLSILRKKIILRNSTDCRADARYAPRIGECAMTCLTLRRFRRDSSKHESDRRLVAGR